jgi:catechol 2,3-dioxygenase
MGFYLHRKENGTAYLGAGDRDLLILSEKTGATLAPRHTGLYHFAILLPSRLALAGMLRHLIKTNTRIDGASDHLVSEAVYLRDPDGLGIEIYRDRHKKEWPIVDGRIEMDNAPFDLEGVLDELGNQSQDWTGLPEGTSLGHVHLHVAELGAAGEFYNDLVGFDLTFTFTGSALFLSAGGYHHHLGVNTWNGVGVSPPPPDSLGLRYFTIQLPDQTEIEALAARLEEAAYSFERHPDGLFVRDPSQNRLLFTTANHS